jgi:hypothetical protein
MAGEAPVDDGHSLAGRDGGEPGGEGVGVSGVTGRYQGEAEVTQVALDR